MAKTKFPKEWLDFADISEWRTWLTNNYMVATEVWLLIRKSKSKKPGISLASAVTEALCFGWIDGLMYSVDEDGFVLRFSPRKSGSVWSLINKERAIKLISEGKMTEAGMRTIEDAKKSGWWDKAYTSKKL